MIRMRTLSALVAASLMAGCNVAAMAGANQEKEQASATAARCEIVVTKGGGSTMISGVLRSGVAVSGEYSLKVDGAGVRIRQGGEFAVGVGEELSLGDVRLGRGSYDAALEITVGGRTTRCSQQI